MLYTIFILVVISNENKKYYLSSFKQLLLNSSRNLRKIYKYVFTLFTHLYVSSYEYVNFLRYYTFFYNQ